MLKRLRTGEGPDWQIKTAPAVSGVVLSFFAEFGRPVATLAAWTVVALVLASKNFRWDDRG